MIVIGDREMENKAVSLRAHGENGSKNYSIEELKIMLTNLNEEKVPSKLR
jgi:threonyl-tRNA synthetase